ncbi:hypothetical protein [Metabacillus idriensis]|uniref:hypothetical protein n=1 Tax=Metabacillus idriensis TaxID=324768 RepID=UPI003D2B1542
MKKIRKHLHNDKAEAPWPDQAGRLGFAGKSGFDFLGGAVLAEESSGAGAGLRSGKLFTLFNI